MIANVRSRKTELRFQSIVRALTDAGVKIVESHTIDGGSNVAKRARAAVRDGAAIVAVAGGDGSMTRAAEELSHSKSTLAVIPVGTGNSFARSLGIGLDTESIARTIADGETRRVDVGIVNGCVFANFATIGLTSVVAEETPGVLKRFLGAAAYVLSGIVVGLRLKPFTVKLKIDDAHFEGTTHQVIVASGRYFGEQPLTPSASPLSGKLAIFMATTDHVPGLLEETIAAALGRHLQLRDAHSWSARRIRITTKAPQLIAIDGRPIGKTPARMRVDPKALRVLVPPGFDGLS